MTCRECEALLARYEETVRMFSDASKRFSEQPVDPEALRTACEKASEELLTHWRAAHKTRFESATQPGSPS